MPQLSHYAARRISRWSIRSAVFFAGLALAGAIFGPTVWSGAVFGIAAITAASMPALIAGRHRCAAEYDQSAHVTVGISVATLLISPIVATLI